MMALAATTGRAGIYQPFHPPSTISVPSLAQTTDTNPDGQRPDSDRITIRSDRQEMNEEEGILTAEGRVRIVYPAHDVTATADHARYFTREGRLILSGGVEVKQTGGNSIRGERLVYTSQSRTFVVESRPGEQVQSTYDLSSPTRETLTP
ncbi:LptA/OstA family protein [Candidatus Synechococcus spongiarum]|nr:LptA/OstA family protein [Candidatus Synechococcus spongiarum]